MEVRVFSAEKGGFLDLHSWRERGWRPALDARGISTNRRIYDLRHTFATDALHAGLSIFELARYIGTSAAMIDHTYGHLARGSEAIAKEKLDAVAGRSGVYVVWRHGKRPHLHAANRMAERMGGTRIERVTSCV
jgi:integrase